MRLSALILIFLTITAAADRDVPTVALERGHLLMEIHADYNAAIACFTKVLSAPDATSQQRAEAGLALAECHYAKGRFAAAIEAARRVSAKPAGVEPFAAAATELALDASGSDQGDTALPAPTDTARMTDLILLLEGALRNSEIEAAIQLIDDMRITAVTMISECELAASGDGDGDAKRRKDASATARAILDETAALAEAAGKADTGTLLPLTQGKALKKLRARNTGPKRGNFTARLFQTRDLLCEALSANDAGRITTIARELATTLAPIANGAAETDVALFASSECAMLKRVETLGREGKTGEARSAYRSAWRTMHRNFDTGRVLQIPRGNRVEPAAASGFIGALTHVEAAIHYLAEDDPPKARVSITDGIRILTSIPGNAATKERAQESVRQLREALQHIEKDDPDGAASLLNSELYSSP